jgi:hypothetical protein
MSLTSRLASLASVLLLGALLGACDLTESGATGDTSGEADSVATNVTWSTTATAFRADSANALRVAYDCPANGTASVIWGSDTYTDDSSVCTAGVHAGKITLADGGRVIIEMRPGQSAYTASTRNGVTSLQYGSWMASYVLL